MYMMWFCIQKITLQFCEYAAHHLHDKYVSFFAIVSVCVSFFENQ